jgi:uncharacterized protein
MTVSLRELLSRLRAHEGVELAAAVANDGLLIECAARPGLDVEAISAVTSNGLAFAEALGREIAKGGALQTIMEYEHGLVLLQPITSEVMLLMMTSSRDSLGRIRFLIDAHREKFIHAIQHAGEAGQQESISTTYTR